MLLGIPGDTPPHPMASRGYSPLVYSPKGTPSPGQSPDISGHGKNGLGLWEAGGKLGDEEGEEGPADALELGITHDAQVRVFKV